MFTLRERIEILVLIVIVVFGTPIAMSFGASQAKEDLKVLNPYEIPKEVQRALDQQQEAIEKQKALEQPVVLKQQDTTGQAK